MALFYSISVSKRTVLFSPIARIIHFCSAASSPPSPDDNTTVTTAVSILKHHRSKSRWTHLRTLFPSGFNPSQFSEITLQLRNNPHLALRFFLFTIKHSLCHHSLLSYATIIHTLARSRQKSHALTLIQSAIRKFSEDSTNPHSNTPPLIFETLIKTYRTCDSAPFVFDLLIKACLRSKRVNQAIEIVRMLGSKGIYPMTSTCNSLIMSVSKHHGSIAGYEVYNELFGSSTEFEDKKVVNRGKTIVPNVHTYNIIMHAFYRDGLVENLERVWSDMIVNDCLPSEYSYSILMAAYCDNGRMVEAMRVWREMENKGLEHDVMAYNTIIGGFCENGNVQKAEEFFKGMESSGKEATCVTHEHLINGYCKIGDVASAMLMYKDMCMKGFMLVGCTLDVLIKELCEKDKVSEALMVLKVAMKRNNVTVKNESYEVLIKGLCDDGRMDEGMKLQAEMVGRGYEPTSGIYGAFIDGYEKEGNIELADKLRMELLEMQQPFEKCV
uniref:pentatricopeptide repeat-containing protein At2g15980 n=1 Tax=Erigeron canadensis TaxID=72917 RepID=UPI001CB9AD66|nr:pentatricopeptide repeat-containing protein At2g15980 [Erigeron canadensis]XP_043638621.1 pentatricopeptide repeat-containing protein At2g15980 [Erigeron canadensis]